MKDTIVITIPNVLASDVMAVEALYEIVTSAESAAQYIFDMSEVSFVHPYGVIALVTIARLLSLQSGRPIQMKMLNEEVHKYLERMDLFEVDQSWLQPACILDESWERNPTTENLLELNMISNSNDVEHIVSRAESIFSRWLMVRKLNKLMTVLSELCSNAHEHSGDTKGYVLIQKFEMTSRNSIVVRLAVGDLGCGIRGSLIAQHGKLGDHPIDYLYEAMRGRTARPSGRGGIGLRHVQRIVGTTGGHLYLRSESAAIFTPGPDRLDGHIDLCNIPGTQVAVEIHAPLSH